MSKNTGSENLAWELAALPRALESVNFAKSSQAVILARLVRGLSCESWQKASEGEPLSQWHALPVPAEAENDEELEELQSAYKSGLPVSPFREVEGALTRSMFISLLQRELLRLSRTGGSLSLISASVVDRRALVEKLGESAVCRLDALLGRTLLSRLDACDALGLIRKGNFVCSLPGLGQLAARNFAETAQAAFQDTGRSMLGEENNLTCAFGVVNILQGESCSPTDLLKRARATLEVAQRKQSGHIHQEAAIAPFEGTTLVHSSEKRFLFFGGDPK